MGSALNAIPIVGPLLGGLVGGAQQSQQQGQGNALLGSAAGALNTNEGFIKSLLNGLSTGTGPLSELFGTANSLSGIGQGLENANVFPSAGTSAMNTLLSRVGSVANPGAVIEDTSAQIGQEGIAGQIGAKEAGAGIIGNAGSLMSSGLGSIAQLLTGGNSAASGLGNLGQTYLNNAAGMGSPFGSAISGITSGLTSAPLVGGGTSLAAKLG